MTTLEDVFLKLEVEAEIDQAGEKLLELTCNTYGYYVQILNMILVFIAMRQNHIVLNSFEDHYISFCIRRFFLWSQILKVF